MDRRFIVRLLSTALVISVLLPQICSASSYNGEILVPTPDNGPYLSTHSTRTLRKHGWTIGATFDIAHRSLELAGPAGGRVSGVLEDFFFMHVLGAFSVLDWLQLGIDVPVALVDRTVDTTTGNTALHIRMSDIRLEAKFKLLDPDRYGWGIAAIPFVTLPTGSGARLVGDGTVTGGAKLAFETPDIGHVVRLALNVGYQMRDSTILFGTEVDDWLHYSLAANFRVNEYFEIIPEIYGKTLAGELFARESQSPLELGGLLRIFFMKRRLSLDVGGSGGLLSGIGAPVWRGIVRLAFKPLARSAHDDVTLSLSGELTAEDYYLLSKQCPPNPDDWDRSQHDVACDKVYELRGLYGECPPPEDFDASRDDAACEKVYELQAFDRDGDGVPDYLDRCPDEPGPIEYDGCPAGDVILDWQEGRIKSDKILFEFNSATLGDRAHEVLRQVAAALIPKIKLGYIRQLTIEGHTDSVGLREYNQSLSQRRAQAVKSYLAKQGVPAHIMQAIGLGQSRPAVSNDTEQGQQQNRRVEIRFNVVY